MTKIINWLKTTGIGFGIGGEGDIACGITASLASGFNCQALRRFRRPNSPLVNITVLNHHNIATTEHGSTITNTSASTCS